MGLPNLRIIFVDGYIFSMFSLVFWWCVYIPEMTLSCDVARDVSLVCILLAKGGARLMGFTIVIGV